MTDSKGNRERTCLTCEKPELLMAYAARSLGVDERALIERSLETCESCRLAARDNEHLARAVRMTPAPRDETTPEHLVALASRSRQEIAEAGLSASDTALIDILQRVDAELAHEKSPILGARFLELWDSVRESASWGWLRSPAVAYLLLLVFAYPAYQGITAGGRDAEPLVLHAPRALDTTERAADEPVVAIDDDGRVVITVFVPIDERYRYRLEILDPSGRSRFVDNDVRSFDTVGTIAILLPPGFLASGSHEVRVSELERTDADEPIDVFRFPFQIR